MNSTGGLGGLAVEVRDLTVSLASGQPIVESVSLEVASGKTLGIIGESGSGKTTLGLALLGYTRPGAKITAGSVLIGAQEMLGKPEQEVRSLRGRTVGYVPQDPATALIPTLRVDEQISELQRIHLKQQDPVARNEVLQLVHLPSDRSFRRRYPHQLSGGQQQRLAIALALVSRPQVLVLDEPTTGLDVVTQEHILESIVQIQSETGVAILYVSHNLAVVASVVHRVAVMYAGRIVEESEATPRFFGHPRHPYAAGLIASVPDHRSPRQLHGLAGIAVSVTDRPAGCAFEPRCPQRTPRCAMEMPILEDIGSGHEVRCFEWRVTPEISVEDRPLDRIGSGQYTCLSVEGLSAAAPESPRDSRRCGFGQLQCAEGGVPGARRRVGQREDDDRPLHCWASPTLWRNDHARRHRSRTNAGNGPRAFVSVFRSSFRIRTTRSIHVTPCARRSCER